MLTTNLLPQEEKKAPRFEELTKIASFFGFTGLLVFICGIALLLPSYIPLLFEKSALERALKIEESAAQELKSDELSREAGEARALLKSTKDAFSRAPAASVLLTQFFDKAARARITIEMLSISKSGQVTMNGFAPTRRNLLEFERILRESGSLQEVVVPLSNIILETDIAFTFRGTLAKNSSL
ncbi:MAG: hypothetical protein G01um101433_345 [Parcubacteria group bacterium Gr01-1014_33]|nr:MAG: hypothetical protein G01um101433_345 [Parcubacteria group bacterium Gr01-1014_33]